MRGQRILNILLILILIINVPIHASLSSRVKKKLTGGSVSTKTYSLWELHKFKDTELLTMDPLCWTPWRSYLSVSRYVSIDNHNNLNRISINANLIEMLSADAKFNKAFCRRFKVSGSTRKKVRQIYNFCRKTVYTAHVKSAREIFTLRKGDCAGISAAFYVLCRSKRIPVKYIIGWVGEWCHAWNRVKVSGKWYWIDCTHSLWLSAKQFSGRKVMEVW